MKTPTHYCMRDDEQTAYLFSILSAEDSRCVFCFTVHTHTVKALPPLISEDKVILEKRGGRNYPELFNQLETGFIVVAKKVRRN